MVQRRNLQLNGLRLSWLEQGTSTPGVPSLLLLHGLMGCADTMRYLLEALPADRHVLALDFPGAGQSERRRDSKPTLANTTAIVKQFAEALNLGTLDLVGHSHGGAVALQLAATHPEAVHSLTLLAPAHPYFEQGDPVIRFYRSLPGRLFAYSMPWYPRWMQMIGLRRMAGPQSWDSIDKLKPYRENLRTRGTMSHLLRLLSTWHQDMAALGKLLRTPLATPTLLLWGESDRAVPPISIVELRAHLAYSELRILPGIGHRPAEEAPAQVAAFILEWLTDRLAHPSPHPYSPNSSESQDRIPAFSTSSFEAGEPAIPAKKWSAPSTHKILFGSDAETRTASKTPRGLKASWSPLTNSLGTLPQPGKKP